MFHEENIILKSFDGIDIKVGIIFPDYYENSLLSLGYQIVYHMLNDRDDCFCERIVFPYTKSIETGTSLNDFDILSFTIHHTTGYFNMIEMLKNANISILSEDRVDDDPLIIAGGPIITGNPMPVERFFDICCIGEGENILNPLLDTYKKFENPKAHLEEFLKIEGLYIPKFKNHTKITLIDNMDEKFHIYKPFTVKDENDNIVNSISLDVLRGCSHGCRFCMAGFLYKPSRQISFDKIIEIAEKSREYSGINSVYLVGPDLSDFSRFVELIETLHNKGFNVGVPSVRLEKITRELLQYFKDSGLNRFDIAPESIFKIRKSLNKDVPDDLVQNVIEMALDVGLGLKFLFLIGFPNETDDDVVDLARYIKSILKTRDRYDKNLEIDFRISPVVPKPHTPFQWEPFNMSSVNSKINLFLEELSDLNLKCIGNTMFGLSYTNYSINVRFDFNSNEDCFKDYILSCGGSEVGELIMGSDYNVPLSEWEKYFPKYEIGDELPWDCINLGYRDSFISIEHKKMLDFKVTPWCGDSLCYNCKDNCNQNILINRDS